MKNSKAKGSRFELEVAKKLTKWSGCEFHRTPCSGALHWDNDKRVVSDIVPPQNMNFPFSIECKNQEIPFDFDFLLKGTSTIWDFWKQACDDAISESLLPMLVFTKNYRDVYVAIPTDVFIILFNKKNKPNYLSVSYQDVVVLNFDEFLSRVSLDEILKITVYSMNN